MGIWPTLLVDRCDDVFFCFLSCLDELNRSNLLNFDLLVQSSEKPDWLLDTISCVYDDVLHVSHSLDLLCGMNKADATKVWDTKVVKPEESLKAIESLISGFCNPYWAPGHSPFTLLPFLSFVVVTGTIGYSPTEWKPLSPLLQQLLNTGSSYYDQSQRKGIFKGDFAVIPVNREHFHTIC